MMTGTERLYLAFGQSSRNLAAASLPDDCQSKPAYIYDAIWVPKDIRPSAMLSSLALPSIRNRPTVPYPFDPFRRKKKKWR